VVIDSFSRSVREDARFALRLFRRAPGFTAIAIATVAIGIGGSTAIFSVVDAVLLRPLRFPAPEQLVTIRPTSGSRVSAGYLYEWRLGSRALADMAGWEDVRANLTGRGAPIEVQVDRTTTNFFELLGRPAYIGRTFRASRDLAVGPREVVLSHAFWQRRYGGDARVVGQPMTLDGEVFTIVGVMPAGFTIRTNELAESHAEIWIPLRLVPEVPRGMGGFLNVVGRLAPGVTIEQSQAELAAIAKRLEAAHPSSTSGWGVEVVSLLAATVKDVRLTLLVLLGAVGILLAIGCANVASLMLNRVVTREPELAIRLSLGATPGRLMRQLLTESLVLSAPGGVLGVLLAAWGTRLLMAFLPPGLEIPRLGEIGVNMKFFGVAALALVCVVLFVAVVPWFTTTRSIEPASLRTTTRGASAGHRRAYLGGTLVVLEIALALTLLAGAGLLGRSFFELSRVNPGFQTEQLLTVRTTLPQPRYGTPDRVRAFTSSLLERVQHLPGVTTVGVVNYLPMSNFGIGGSFSIDGRPLATGGERPGSWISVVGGDYFAAMGIPLVRGRFFNDADNERTPSVFIIDEELARRYWPGENPIGGRITWQRGEAYERNADGPVTGEIVGVVGSVRWAGMAAKPLATTYWWFPQVPRPQVTMVARSAGDPNALTRAIAAQVNEIDPDQPVSDIRAMRDFVSDDLARPQFTMSLLAGFAVAAVLLSAIGLYGLIAFGVTQRTREIGVRIALGAGRRSVIGLVLRRGLMLAGAGLAVGLAAALALGRVMTGLVYGITPSDPLTFFSVAVFLVVVALLATYIPARRAAGVDPMVALRAE
jgi:putative ABC transport system permease protein